MRSKNEEQTKVEKKRETEARRQEAERSEAVKIRAGLGKIVRWIEE